MKNVKFRCGWALGLLACFSALANADGLVSQPFTLSGSLLFPTVSGSLLQYLGVASPPVNATRYVDKYRTDLDSSTAAKTPDGSFARPYLTIQAALNAIASSGLNSTSHADTIDIVGPGSYAEALTMNNAAFFNVVIRGHGHASATSFSSSATNTQLAAILVDGLNFTSTISMTGDVNGTSFCSGGCLFQNLTFAGGTVANALVVEFLNSTNNGTFSFTNISGGQVLGGTGMAPNVALTVTHDNAQNKPAGMGSSGTSVIFEKALGGISNVSAGATLQFREGCRVGNPGNTETISGNLIDYGTVHRGNITINSGAVWTPTFSSYTGTLTNNGTITAAGNIESANFTSTQINNSSDVSGSTVTAALNTLNNSVQEVLLTAHKNGGSVTANTTIPTWTSDKDTLSGFNASTGVYTAQSSGDFYVVFNANTTAATPKAQIYKNGVLVQTGQNALTATHAVTVIPAVVATDTITVALDTNATLTSSNTDTTWSVFQISGSPTAVINARYHGATATITSSLSDVSYTTSDFDSASAYSGATYTVPSTGGGKYDARCSLAVTATTVAAGNSQVLALLKNGTEVARNTFTSGAATQKPVTLVVEDLISLAGSDTVKCQVSSNSTAPTVSASNTLNTFFINKMSN